MKDFLRDERGSALLLSIGVLVILAAIAVVIVSIAVSEKKSQFATLTQSRAFYSADAAGEAGINWIRIQNSPPSHLDAQKHVYIAGSYTPLSADHSYKCDVTFVTKSPAYGWDADYKNFEYLIDGSGTSVQQSDAAIQVNATRLFREGYQ
jgi:Tfp pilus assembly protein PilX